MGNRLLPLFSRAIKIILFLFILPINLLSPWQQSPGQTITLQRPNDWEFVIDKANLITFGDRVEVKEVSQKLLNEQSIPLVTVTIEAMRMYTTIPMSIETFATTLYNSWGIGHPKIGGKSFNKGILLLVSLGDRKARIELGAGFGADHETASRTVMSETIIPNFKEGNYSKGILEGVEQLSRLAKDQDPTALTLKDYAVIGGVALVVGLIFFTLISYAQSQKEGLAWRMWSTIFGAFGEMMSQPSYGYNDRYDRYNRRTRFGSYYDDEPNASNRLFGSSGSRSSSGGSSFGGGSSSSGGSTGSW
ncbi:MAG: TPM domain-containing protein [bacterium]